MRDSAVSAFLQSPEFFLPTFMKFFGGVFLPAVYLEITPNTHANTSCRFVLRSLRIAATPSFIAAHSLFSDKNWSPYDGQESSSPDFTLRGYTAGCAGHSMTILHILQLATPLKLFCRSVLRDKSRQRHQMPKVTPMNCPQRTLILHKVAICYRTALSLLLDKNGLLYRELQLENSLRHID